MKSPETHLYLSLRIFQLLLILLPAYLPAVRAQDHPVQQLTAPPPPKVISREDRAQIDATKEAKARIRTTIELGETHLAKAESLSSQQDHNGATASLGRYAALIDDALNFLSTMSRERNKTRDLYKRLELALRAHGPRLTAMRRSTPLEYAVWIKELEDFARKGRTEALNSFYGHTVFRDQQKANDEKRSTKPKKDDAPVPERKPK